MNCWHAKHRVSSTMRGKILQTSRSRPEGGPANPSEHIMPYRKHHYQHCRIRAEMYHSLDKPQSLGHQRGYDACLSGINTLGSQMRIEDVSHTPIAQLSALFNRHIPQSEPRHSTLSIRIVHQSLSFLWYPRSGTDSAWDSRWFECSLVTSPHFGSVKLRVCGHRGHDWV
jgi:hypothetical protein